MPRTKTTTEVELLPCDLTNDELVDRAKQLAAAGRKIEDKEADHAALKAQMRSEMKLLTAKRDNLNGIVAAGREYREVTVKEVHDYDSGMFKKIRTDTGEVIFERELAGDERKMPLDFELDHADAPTQQDVNEAVAEFNNHQLGINAITAWPELFRHLNIEYALAYRNDELTAFVVDPESWNKIEEYHVKVKPDLGNHPDNLPALVSSDEVQKIFTIKPVKTSSPFPARNRFQKSKQEQPA